MRKEKRVRRKEGKGCDRINRTESVLKDVGYRL